MEESPNRLKEMAEWYRRWARIGNDEDRGPRLRFAEYLEERAREIERAQKHAAGG